VQPYRIGTKPTRKGGDPRSALPKLRLDTGATFRDAMHMSVDADPFVQDMVSTFDAFVVPGSVRPIVS